MLGNCVVFENYRWLLKSVNKGVKVEEREVKIGELKGLDELSDEGIVRDIFCDLFGSDDKTIDNELDLKGEVLLS